LLGENVTNVVFALPAKDLRNSFSTFLAFFRKTNGIVSIVKLWWFLAMAYEVDGGFLRTSV
jgi:hypothetical protein